MGVADHDRGGGGHDDEGEDGDKHQSVNEPTKLSVMSYPCTSRLPRL